MYFLACAFCSDINMTKDILEDCLDKEINILASKCFVGRVVYKLDRWID